MPKTNPASKFNEVHALTKQGMSVQKACTEKGLSTSGYYAWRASHGSKPAPRKRANPGPRLLTIPAAPLIADDRIFAFYGPMDVILKLTKDLK